MSEQVADSPAKTTQPIDLIAVEVVYATVQKQSLLELMIPIGSDVEYAIHASDILQQYPEIDLNQQKVGIFGKIAKLNDSLREKDRIEIYRPLIADPKEVRRQRAAQGKKMKKGGDS